MINKLLLVFTFLFGSDTPSNSEQQYEVQDSGGIIIIPPKKPQKVEERLYDSGGIIIIPPKEPK